MPILGKGGISLYFGIFQREKVLYLTLGVGLFTPHDICLPVGAARRHRLRLRNPVVTAWPAGHTGASVHNLTCNEGYINNPHPLLIKSPSPDPPQKKALPEDLPARPGPRLATCHSQMGARHPLLYAAGSTYGACLFSPRSRGSRWPLATNL